MKSIFIRKRGKKYYVYLEYVDPTSGKRKQKSQGRFDRKKDAQALLVKLKHSVISNKFIMPSSITFVDYVAEYINLHEEVWAPNTVRNYRSILKNSLIPYFGDLEIQKLSPLILQEFYNDLVKKVSAKYLKLYHALIGATLKKAYRLRVIESNPCDFIEVPKKKDTFESDVYDKEKARKLVRALEGHVLEIPVLLALTLGLRASEVCGLTWDNIDLDEGVVTVEHILYVKNGEYILKEPKTKSSKRSISMPKEMIPRLKLLRRKQAADMLSGKLSNPLNLVNFNKRLNPVTPNYLSKFFKKLLEDCGLDNIRLHDLRHTNATLLILMKYDVKVVASRLGHASVKTTMDVYTKVLAETDSSAGESLSEAIFG